MKKRLFIALPIEEEALLTLKPYIKKLKIDGQRKEMEINWTREENLHITLFFLGPTEETKVAELKSAMSQVATQHPPVLLEIRQCGGFPEERHARALYFGVGRNRALVQLQEDLSQALVQLGFSPDARAFIPHITFARLRKSRSVENFLSPFARKSFVEYESSRLILYESVQRGPQSLYFPLHEENLIGRAPLPD